MPVKILRFNTNNPLAFVNEFPPNSTDVDIHRVHKSTEYEEK
jgi:hypothetical protein